jgi:hypothetical protein
VQSSDQEEGEDVDTADRVVHFRIPVVNRLVVAPLRVAVVAVVVGELLLLLSLLVLVDSSIRHWRTISRVFRIR